MDNAFFFIELAAELLDLVAREHGVGPPAPAVISDDGMCCCCCCCCCCLG